MENSGGSVSEQCITRFKLKSLSKVSHFKSPKNLLDGRCVIAFMTAFPTIEVTNPYNAMISLSSDE